MIELDDRIESGRVAIEIFVAESDFSDVVEQYCIEKEGSAELYDTPSDVIKDLLSDVRIAEQADEDMGLGGVYEESDMKRLEAKARNYLKGYGYSDGEIKSIVKYAKRQAEYEMEEA